MKRLFVLLLALITFNGFAQELSREEIADFKKEGQQLIAYLEFTLNAIGDNDLTAKEKDVIISESFLKMFRNAKVQIEDDLDASRETVTNKDVQAYLKDVDFFFRVAHFTLNILSIDVQVNENGKPFLLTNILRNLEAVDINGDSIQNDQQRFIEIELDSDRRELKIASIYTTKLNENEENIRWWNLLPDAWKNILGQKTTVFDSINFSSILEFSPTYFLLESKELQDQTMEEDSLLVFSGNQPYEVMYVKQYDTIWLNDTLLQKETAFKALNGIIELTELDINGNQDIINLEPLSKLSNLRTLDVSNTSIEDIYPVRNLTKLHNLNCSGTFINKVDALVYSMELRVLNISNTAISSLKDISNLVNLKILDISNTQVEDLSSCSEMTLLEDLKMRNTMVMDLEPLQTLTSLNYLDLSDNEQIQSLDALKNLSKLKVLYCNNTAINNLEPLSKLENLETLYCENAEITSLEGLQNIKALRKIYCDNSLLGRQKAIDFMKLHPQILVVYESKQLQLWWDELPSIWRSVFSDIVELGDVPSKEQLHQITTIKEINISGYETIKSLLPLEKLKYLQSLNASGTKITSLDGIAEAREMRFLNISNTDIQHLYALENLNLIEELNISNCLVSDLYPLSGLINLKRLSIENTKVANIDALYPLRNLLYLNADHTSISEQAALDFIEKKEDLLLVYMTSELSDWWTNLSPEWKSIFSNRMHWTQEPQSEDLHALIKIKSLEIKDNRLIDDLNPIKMLLHLRTLKVIDTKISNVAALSELVFLQDLDLSKNPITDFSP
ncbi:MAG: leucine-rich repeat domain-containing protein, partial [Bacteroidales bacterium]|nr:leucine-rich repeat domain-containing protein [Bacteroidales bacterium]